MKASDKAFSCFYSHNVTKKNYKKIMENKRDYICDSDTGEKKALEQNK